MRGHISILRLNKAGYPVNWISKEEAATLYCKDLVVWELGENVIPMFGGIRRDGTQSMLPLAPIIASDGMMHTGQPRPPLLNNRLLFRRDGYQCLYCGDRFRQSELTRDHIVPRAQGGADSWTNVVAACKRCNHAKGNRTPEQADMPLLAIPFTPNEYELLYLANHHILADQSAFLTQRMSKKRDWAA